MDTLTGIFIFLAFICLAFAVFNYKAAHYTGDALLIRRVIGWGSGVILCVLLIFASNVINADMFEKSYPASADATVLSVEEKSSNIITVVNGIPVITRTTRYIVQYSFVAEGGITYGGKDTTHKKPVSDSITIQYNPESPTENAIP